MTMNRKQIQTQIKDLKGQIKIANRATNARLIQLTLVMLVLLLAVAIIYGKIQF